ncbi:phosphatidate cytidylyltransferase [Ligilactobacillus ceti]|uniref:Phosphatidate cytidylyltransferase n=1 Tax=Ligilactobacillus ceti DSM 22408 TaxID=1122146 RepID=A0A0R2KPQ4_9LACO|nr:phosphatidate cytidylyltransferase [Ligilactobacillus ceti]KRN88618.1 phosphatidate cytidylyltransferase [Ligilactobacillus ceti DSM 22408]
MKQRVITAVIALIVFIPILIYGGWAFNILGVVLGLIGISEIITMKKKLLISPEAIFTFLAGLCLLFPIGFMHFTAKSPIGWTGFTIFMLCLLIWTVFSKNRFSFEDAGSLILGALYIGLGFHYMLVARSVGLSTMFYAFIVVWMTDTGAYMIGRKIGRNKLAPHVSPNKTWEGSIGGTLVAVIVAGIYLYFFPQRYSLGIMIGLTVIFSIAGQLGDLIESALKRHFGVKDSGQILPGHGGILDRFDSLLLVLPVMHFLGIF